MLSATALQEFKKKYVEEFGEEISDEQATKLGVNLLTLLNHIYHPVKKEWLLEIPDAETCKCETCSMHDSL